MRRRSVDGLKSAVFCEPPKFRPTIKKTRRVACKRGLQYERRVILELTDLYSSFAEVKPGPWIKYEDRAGTAICQPDCLLIPKDPALPIVIVECKLSHRPRAREKLAAIYGPVVEMLYPGRPQRHVQITRSLRRGRGAADSNDIDDLLKRTETYLLIHWF
jgi:hypothetical protein